MTSFLQRIGDDWLVIQACASALYIVLTLPSFVTRKPNRFSLWPSLWGLSLFALTTPFFAVFQPSFWTFIGGYCGLWLFVMLYDGFLASAISKTDDAMPSYLLPFMLGVLSLPVSIVAHYLWLAFR